jgi:phosphoglycerate kinase
MKLICQLPAFDLNRKRVLLRADLNVPLVNGNILNDYRLRAVIPTLELIHKKNGRIVLMTHMGRPKKEDSGLSTQLLIPWFKSQGFSVVFAQDPAQAKLLSMDEHNSIILLENLRFFPGEKNQDAAFAQSLADCGDFYVDDAFASMHRKDSSIWLVPQLFAKSHRTFGLLVETELRMLNKLIHNPKKPFLLVIGGGKVVDKLPLLENLLDRVTDILLCPAIVFTFLKSKDLNVGTSLIDSDALESCKKLLEKANQKKVNVHFPLDYQVANQTLQGSLSFVDAQNFPANGMGISIGPKTITQFSKIIEQAQTIFFNAAMGFALRPETMVGTRALLQAVAQSKAYRVVGGGDSVAAAQNVSFAHTFDHLSTGGGATLAYLSGEPLPGLVALEK